MHVQLFALPILRFGRHNLWRRIDALLVLMFYVYPVIALISLFAALLYPLFFDYPPFNFALLSTFSFLVGFGNFAPYFQIAVAVQRDRQEQAAALLPFIFVSSAVGMLASASAFALLLRDKIFGGDPVGQDTTFPAGAGMSLPWVSAFGAVVLIIVLIGIHAAYFQFMFRSDTRLNIQFASGSDPVSEYLRRLHQRVGPSADAQARTNLPGMVELKGEGTPERSGVEVVSEIPLRMGDLAEERPLLSVVSWSDVQLQGEVRAPSVFARRIDGLNCGAIELEHMIAAEECEIVAASLRSRSITVGRGRLQVEELYASKISSPNLSIERSAAHAAHMRERWRKPTARAAAAEAAPYPMIFQRALVIAEHSMLRQPVVAYRDVDIRANAVIEYGLKAYGRVRIGDGVELCGPVISNSDVYVGENCVFWADIVTKGDLILQPGVQFGRAADRLVSVVARRIRFGNSTRLAGTMRSSLPLEIRYA